ncbi:MAG: hypothetical protein ABJP48_06405 [Erythrobacter sp.]
MKLSAAIRGFAALGAALALSGCVAAVVPILAGGAIVRSGTADRQDTSEPSTSEPPEIIALDTTVEHLAPAEQQTVNAISQVQLDIASISPEGLPASRIGAQQSTPRNRIAEFIDFAAAKSIPIADLDPASNAPIESAMLRNPSTLNGERIPCGELAPAVLIDLDPANGLLTSASIDQVDPSLTEKLAQLRNLGVQIAWITGHSADAAGAIRAMLRETNLDTSNQDEVLLMRYPEDRKQTLRIELAQSHCIIAIAGDTRADFDELFDYLKEPAAALALERMIGDGWFLIPPLLD